MPALQSVSFCPAILIGFSITAAPAPAAAEQSYPRR
jgi:hypothetical protein